MEVVILTGEAGNGFAEGEVLGLGFKWVRKGE
jgi:hypothetical protein